MSAATRTLLDEHGVSADVIADSAEREIWNAHESSLWDHPGLVVKISVLPTDVESCLRLTAGSLSSPDWCAIGQGRPRRSPGSAERRRERARGCGETPPARRRQGRQPRWSCGATPLKTRRPQSQGDAALRAVMDAVKARFDPKSILPGLPWSLSP